MGRKRIEFFIGQKFNKLTIVDFSHTKHDKYWKCKCDCGRERIVAASNIKTGRVKDCGIGFCKSRRQIIDLTNQKFDKLTVLKFFDINKIGARWICQCDCGNKRIVPSEFLKNRTVKTCRSNQCKNDLSPNRFLNLTGKKFFYLTVLNASYSNNKRLWLCRCQCGKERIVSSASLLYGWVKNCGENPCKRIFRLRKILNKKFNKLTIKSFSHIYKNKIFWNCECDCGNKIIVKHINVISGNTKTCGDIKCKRSLSNYRRSLNLKNKKIGTWTVKEKIINSSKIIRWNCVCECGLKQNLSAGYLSESLRHKKNIKCKRCIVKFLSGKNHHSWNHNLTKAERIAGKRKSAKAKKWRKIIYQKGNYRCQVTGKKGKLCAHHLEAWNLNKDLRFDPDNGILVLESLHKQFHKIYGSGGNTKSQFDNFISSLTEEQLKNFT